MIKLRRALLLAAVVAVVAVPAALALAATPPLPTVSTSAATGVGNAAATLNGTVNPNGQATQYAFQWGPTTGYGHETALTSAGSGKSSIAVAASITGLNPGTRYHFRIIAISAGGTAVGGDVSFTTTGTAPTPSTPPSVTTGSATGIGGTTATVSGTVNPRGHSTSYTFEYGRTTHYGFQTPLGDAGAGTAAVTKVATLGGLTPGTTYHYRLVAFSSAGTALGGDHAFTTPTPPVISTGVATDVTSTSATLNGTVNPSGHSTTYQFQFGTTPFLGLSTPPAGVGSGTSDIAVHQSVTGLAPGTTYYYRLIAQSAQGSAFGTEQRLTTPGAPQSLSHVAVLGRTGYVSPRGGFVGVVLGCFGGSTPCSGHFVFTRGRTVYAQRNFTLAPNSGGFQNVKLTRAAQRALFHHYRGPVAVQVNVTTSTGQRISQALHLARWY